MQFLKVFLRLFGEGTGDGAAEAGNDSAVSPDVAGQERLRELGVPEQLIQRQAKRAKTAAYAPSEQAEAPVAEVAEEHAPSQPSGRMSWDDIVADPEYNSHIQDMMARRVKGFKEKEAAYSGLAPVFDALSAKYGLDLSDVTKIDTEALVQAVNGDDSYYEEMADELGVSVERARDIDQLEKYRTREEQKKKDEMLEEQSQRHYRSLLQQGEELRQVFPNFDLEQELQNPTFFRLTAPGSGLTVKDAYYAIHHAEIESAKSEVIARTAGQKIANAVQANRSRPYENGSSQASSVTTVDYSRMTRQQREDLKNEIHRAAARGEKLTPESYFRRTRR